MDTSGDLFPTDPGFRSELLNMVENLELDCDSFSSSVKYGPAWTGCGHNVEERERARRLVPTDSQHCHRGFAPHITLPTHTDTPHDIHPHNAYSLSPFLSPSPHIPFHSSLSSVDLDPVSRA